MKAEKKLPIWTRLIVTSLLLVIVANARAQEKRAASVTVY